MAKLRMSALALAAVLMGGAAPPDPNVAAGTPPVAPDGETPGPAQYTPPAACLKAVMAVVTHEGGKLERTLATHSARFGDVWRADFTTPGWNAALISRAICWSDQTVIVMRQRMAPLPLGAGAALNLRHPAAVRCEYTALDNPCRDEPVAMVWLCVKPGLLIYANGRAEAAATDDGMNVGFINATPAETDEAWARRCSARGGVYRAEN